MISGDFDNEGVNMDHVVRWTKAGGKVTLYLTDGETMDLSEHLFGLALERAIRSTVPAQPGTTLLTKVGDEIAGPVVDLWERTLLAFVTSADDITRYMTVDGPIEEGAVRHPDGVVEEFHSGRFADLDEYRRHVIKAHPMDEQIMRAIRKAKDDDLGGIKAITLTVAAERALFDTKAEGMKLDANGNVVGFSDMPVEVQKGDLRCSLRCDRGNVTWTAAV